MRAILMALVLAAAPAAVDAQHHPVPGDTARTVPKLAPINGSACQAGAPDPRAAAPLPR
ncbi:MAG TPA: hypothetical protein VEW03_04305 [Longimicrobiaceae bacterium]|nr:hypothetical protein [Longimicrobiaceae bacterium]